MIHSEVQMSLHDTVDQKLCQVYAIIDPSEEAQLNGLSDSSKRNDTFVQPRSQGFVGLSTIKRLQLQTNPWEVPPRSWQICRHFEFIIRHN